MKNRVPRHLRRFVVAQDYERYTAIDQAVWRFVLLQTFARLKTTAHEAYVDGLTQTGMSVEAIPRIEEMDACLSRFGWGAVCVDGFIPPRAFQEFQALGLLPIAAEIRNVRHLAYTPAPDIIHEAAGHAPIVPDAAYASYLKRVGRVGSRAFGSPADMRVYDAIHLLSEVKEDPRASPEQLKRAEENLSVALAGVQEVSEAAKLSRLYWWTAEYGLVGTPDAYRLYGAGLLSSLGETHSLFDPSVKKLALTADCVNVDYDITRPQPQLFVARDFSRLHDVLDEVDQKLAYRVGGVYALRAAERAQEIATIRLDCGLDLVGTLGSFSLDSEGRVSSLRLQGPAAIAEGHRLLAGLGPGELSAGYAVPIGVMRSERFGLAEIERHVGQRVSLSYAGGGRVEGLLKSIRHGLRGAPVLLELEAAIVTLHEGAEAVHFQTYPLPLAASVVTASAGAELEAFFPDSEFPEIQVPRARQPSPSETRLIALYERASGAFRTLAGNQAAAALEEVHHALTRDYPDEWLLRWNLLECFLKLASSPSARASLESSVSSLKQELCQLEVRYAYEAPIATGLRYLGQLAS